MKRFLPLLVLALAAPILASAASTSGLGWYKGDTHVHDDHSSDGSLPRQRARDRAKGNNSVADQIGQAEKQGLQWLPLTDHRTFDQYYDPLWESSKLLLIPGEEANGSPHSIAMGATDSITQGAERAGAPLAHVQQSVWDAHSQGAAWSIAHPDDGEMNDDGTMNPRASVQGVDLVEMWNHASDIEKEIAYSENRWNAGFRYGIAGASDSHFREYWDWQGPSLPTTHVFAAGYNEPGIVQGIRSGRTSLSWYAYGPLISLKADFGAAHGQGGDELFARAGTKGRLRITVERAAGMKVLVYKGPGRSAGVFKSFTPTKANETFTVNVTAPAAAEWYRVEVRRATPRDPNNARDTDLMAAVSPVFISPGPVAARGEVALPADQGADDGASLAAGAGGEFTGFPDIAQGAGVFHVVAETHGAASSQITYVRRNADNPWSPGRVLSGKGVARFPRVAARSLDVWVTWQEDSVQVPRRPQIMLRHSADGGKTWKKAEVIRSLNGRAEHPDIALAANGHPVLVWQEISAGQPFDVMVREVGVEAAPTNLSRPGKTISAGSPDDTRSARYPASVWPAVATAPDGRIAVAWQDNRTDADPLWTGSAEAAGTNPDNWQIQVVATGPDGQWLRPNSFGADDRADRHPDIQFGAGNELVLAWETKELNPAGRNLSIVTAVFAPGQPVRNALPFPAANPAAMSQRPRLGLEADGAVRLVWYDSRSADWRWRVMTSVLRRGAWDAGTLLTGKGVNTWPATAGGAIVFASTRGATRLQRDQTQQVFVRP